MIGKEILFSNCCGVEYASWQVELDQWNTGRCPACHDGCVFETEPEQMCEQLEPGDRVSGSLKKLQNGLVSFTDNEVVANYTADQILVIEMDFKHFIPYSNFKTLSLCKT
jgi:hypothetical protein